MIRTIKILVLALILTAASAPAAMASAVICECPSKRCYSAGQWWPYCGDCVCGGSSTVLGPEPYSQPVDSSFLKNNFNLNNDNLMQFIRDAFQSPLTDQQISDLLGQAGQTTGAVGTQDYLIRRFDEASYDYSMQDLKYETFKLNKDVELIVIDNSLNQFKKPTALGVPLDMKLFAAACAAAAHGLKDEDIGLAEKVWDRFKEKMEALEQVFPNAMKNLDAGTTSKLYQEAVNEVKKGQ